MKEKDIKCASQNLNVFLKGSRFNSLKFGESML